MRKLWSKTPDWARLLIYLALLTGVPASIGYVDYLSKKFELSKCNDGNNKACENVSYSFRSEITNKDFLDKKKAEKEALLQKKILEREEREEKERARETYLKNNPKALVQSVLDDHELSMRWGCEKEIKKRLKDPGSYKAINVRYFPHTPKELPQAVVDVRINFRAKNSFGGYVVSTSKCASNRNGKIIGIGEIESGI